MFNPLSIATAGYIPISVLGLVSDGYLSIQEPIIPPVIPSTPFGLDLYEDILTILLSDTGLASYVGDRVYTDVPDDEIFPYIVLSVNESPFDVKNSPSISHLIQLNIYSRKKGPLEAAILKSICYSLLHRNEAAFINSAPFLVAMNGVSRTVKDVDGVTWFSVIQFEAVESP